MTLVILVRHAHSTANAGGILAGRTEGVHLSPIGKSQAKRLATRLGEVPIKSLRSSPLERCRETIAPWLKRNELLGSTLNSKLMIDPDLEEVDYGTWSGKRIRSLARNPLWKEIQTQPSKVTFPEGESMLAMQKRAIRAVEKGLAVRGKGHILLVSHGDLLKSIVASALGMHLDEFQRIVIDPASVSILDYSSRQPRVLLLNDSRSKFAANFFAEREKRPALGGGAGILLKKESF